MVPADSSRVPRVPLYLGAIRSIIAISHTGLSPSMAGLSRPFNYSFDYLFTTDDPANSTFRPSRLTIHDLWSCNPGLSFRIARFRLFRFRSPLLSESRLISLPRGTEMVHFPPFAFYRYVFTVEYPVFTQSGFPHSEIPGSQNACFSPRRIAAGRVLHRLLAPRHPHACP